MDRITFDTMILDSRAILVDCHALMTQNGALNDSRSELAFSERRVVTTRVFALVSVATHARLSTTRRPRVALAVRAEPGDHLTALRRDGRSARRYPPRAAPPALARAHLLGRLDSHRRTDPPWPPSRAGTARRPTLRLS